MSKKRKLITKAIVEKANPTKKAIVIEDENYLVDFPIEVFKHPEKTDAEGNVIIPSDFLLSTINDLKLKNVPLIYSAGILLGCLSASAGNRIKGNVMGHENHCSLGILLVGRSATGKSVPISFYKKPFVILRRNEETEYKKKLKKINNEIENIKLSSEANKPNGKKAIYEKEKEIRELEKPKLYINTNGTVEAIEQRVMPSNNGNAFIIYDEARNFQDNSYNNNNAFFGKMLKWLNGYSYDDFDDKLKYETAIDTKNPCANIIANVPTKVFKHVFPKHTEDDGLQARFLISFLPKEDEPPVRMLLNDRSYNIENFNESQTIYNNLIFGLINAAERRDVDEVEYYLIDREILKKDLQIQQILNKLYTLADNGDEPLKNYISKKFITIHCFAMIFQFVEDYLTNNLENKELNSTNVLKAYKLGLYYTNIFIHHNYYSEESKEHQFTDPDEEEFYNSLPDIFKKDKFKVYCRAEAEAKRRKIDAVADDFRRKWIKKGFIEDVDKNGTYRKI